MKERCSIPEEHIDRAWLLWRSYLVHEGAACGSLGRLPCMVQGEQDSCWAGPLYQRTCPLFHPGNTFLSVLIQLICPCLLISSFFDMSCTFRAQCKWNFACHVACGPSISCLSCVCWFCWSWGFQKETWRLYDCQSLEWESDLPMAVRLHRLCPLECLSACGYPA